MIRRRLRNLRGNPRRSYPKPAIYLFEQVGSLCEGSEVSRERMFRIVPCGVLLHTECAFCLALGRFVMPGSRQAGANRFMAGLDFY